MKCIPVPLAVLLCLTVPVACCSVPRADYSDTFYNIHIPAELIAARLAAAGLSNVHDPTKRIYKVIENARLIGSSLNADLQTGAQILPASQYLSNLTHILNGGFWQTGGLNPIVYHSAGFHFMKDAEGRVAAVWGRNIFLEQLYPGKYPDIFIDSMRNPTIISNDRFFQARGGNSSAEMRKNVNFLLEGAVGKQVNSCRVIEVAIAFDNKFCARFGNSADRAINYCASVVWYANRILLRDTCHQLRFTKVEANCRNPSDPYDFEADVMRRISGARSAYILQRFRTIWLSQRQFVSRDVAYFFTGFTEGTNRVGAAYIAGACTSVGFGWAEVGHNAIFTHEIGHSLGATHSSQGIMKSIYTGGSLFFSSDSKVQINTFLRSTQSNCIERL